MIVKDGVSSVGRAIESVRAHVDEVCVYDTGSTDGTLELLAELAAQPGAPIQVERGEWRDDFAWARDHSFAMASPECGWLFRLDADDVMVGAEHLRPLTSSAAPEVDGLLVVYDYERDPVLGLSIKTVWREIVRRKDPSLWGWRFPAHEVWGPRSGSGARACWARVPADVVHVVHERGDGWESSNARNLAILERAVRDGDPAPELRAMLASELAGTGRLPEAVGLLRGFLDDPSTSRGDLRSQAWHELAVYLRQLGDADGAVASELEAIAERDDWAENAVGLAELYAKRQDWPEVERWARRAIEIGLPTVPSGVDPVYVCVTPVAELAWSLCAQERFDEAVPVLHRLALLEPSHPWLAQALSDPRVAAAMAAFAERSAAGDV